MGEMNPKTVVITGCTRGLGRAMLPDFILWDEEKKSGDIF